MEAIEVSGTMILPAAMPAGTQLVIENSTAGAVQIFGAGKVVIVDTGEEYIMQVGDAPGKAD